MSDSSSLSSMGSDNMEELREESASRRSGRVRRPPDPPGSRPMTVNMQVDGAADAADEDAPELEENGDDNDDDNDDEAAEGDDDDDGDEEDNQPNDSRASSRTIRSPTPEDHEPRPWLDWSDHQRHQLELTFTIQTDTLINHSVATTEAYIAHRDEEMLRYLRDFPCSQWMVGQEAARAAYDAMLSRADLRARGQSIVTSRGIPRWWPLGPTPRAPTAVVRPMPPLPPPRPATQAMPLRGSNSPYVSPFPPINQHFAGLPPHMRPFGAQSPMTATPMHAPSPPAVYHQPMGHVPTVGVPLPYPGMQAPFRAADAQTYKRSVQQRLQQQSQQQPRQQPQPNPPSRQASTPQSRFPPPMQLPQSTAPEPRGRPTRQKRLSSQPTIPTSSTNTPTAPSAAAAAAARAITPPPYPRRELPTTAPPRITTGRGHGRRAALRQRSPNAVFPWNRNWAAENPSRWHDDIYPPERLETMDALRARNRVKIDEYENRNKKETSPGDATPSTKKRETTKAEGRKPVKKAKGNGDAAEGGDPYHSGRLRFASDQDQERCKEKGFDDIESAINAAQKNTKDEEFSNVMITYDPGKRSIVDLEVAQFSVMDAARTRNQMEGQRVLSRRAAERIIDFCPDQLWQDRLLQIVSESTVGNKDLAARLGLNGAYIVVSSIAHRISAALGKKQTDAAYGPGEKEWFQGNQADFNKYKAFRNIRPASYAGQSRTASGYPRRTSRVNATSTPAPAAASPVPSSPRSFVSITSAPSHWSTPRSNVDVAHGGESFGPEGPEETLEEDSEDELAPTAPAIADTSVAQASAPDTLEAFVEGQSDDDEGEKVTKEQEEEGTGRAKRPRSGTGPSSPPAKRRSTRPSA